jgi:hypothetical protein
MPATRTAAQAEAARRNGARSRGPATPDGKARASRNALKHGLAAARHLLLDGEDHATYEQLLTDLIQDLAPATALEAQLVRRLAATLWKQERADRLETEILADQPKHDLAYAADHHTLVVNPAATIQLARFNALRAYQAQLGREASRLLRELRLLRTGAIAENEPEPVAREPASEPVPPDETEPPADALQAAAMIATGEPLQILAAARFLGMEDEVTAYFARQEAANNDPPPWPATG